MDLYRFPRKFSRKGGVKGLKVQRAQLLNHVLPGPCLHGVNPAYLHEHKSGVRIEETRKYVQTEQEKPGPPPWEKRYWEAISEAMDLGKSSGPELLAKLCFFSRRSQRRVTKLGLEGVG